MSSPRSRGWSGTRALTDSREERMILFRVVWSYEEGIMSVPWSLIRVCAIAILLHAATPGVLAQDPKATNRDVAVVTGKVERLDPFARSVTLRTADGLQHTVYAGKELKTF